MKNILLLLSLCSFSSCVYHTGMLTAPQSLQNNKKNEFVDIAIGYSSVSYFLGIGGFSNDAFINEAKRNMFLSNPLKNGQSFENTTLDIKTTVIGPYKKVEAIVIADIVEGDTTNKVSYSSNYVKLYKNNIKNIHFLSLNENVVFSDTTISNYRGRIIKLNYSSATIFTTDINGSIVIKKMNYADIYKYNNLDELEKKVGFHKGEKITFNKESNTDQATQQIDGEIIALNDNSVLIKSSTGIKTSEYTNIKKK
jgi:hypothetical protein